MNPPIRRLAWLIALLFGALLVAGSWIQVVDAQDLRERPGNRRTLLNEFGRERGQILVDGEAVATSVPSEGRVPWRRTYPQGGEYAHVTGWFSLIYGSGGGLEGAQSSLLSGTDDSLFYRRLPDLLTGRDPAGATIETTIDPGAQRAAAEALGDRRGAAVAIDPRSGAILAMVSSPTFDPSSLSQEEVSRVEAAWKQFNADPERPLVNRTIGGNTYPPGSVFKLVTAAAALEDDLLEPDSTVPAPRTYTLPGTSTTLRNFGGKACTQGESDEQSLSDALRVSCNTAFADLGAQLGDDRLRSAAEDFGFGEQVRVPMRVTPSTFPDDPTEAQTALAALGQHDVRVTPLQVALISAAIANGGQAKEPHLVEQILDEDLDVISRADAGELDRAVSPETAEQLREMMVSVVESGTGRAAAIPGVRVAGKTGTAEFDDPDGRVHAWFTGFAPADDPQVAVAVVVEDVGRSASGETGTGGSVAAPIARSMMEEVITR
ncbi:peptidoglycan D,D-transpeptidase FtsI family protein [Kytococcus sedentarius]|uniref:peptidoglycan D,D-transpeptidase FtsI family protein n=1 Tax=Kytococcus sedentarius TaxID=1276 RepID=UPI0035BC49A7